MASSRLELTTTWVNIPTDGTKVTVQNIDASNKAIFVLMDTETAPDDLAEGFVRKPGQTLYYVDDGSYLYARASKDTVQVVTL